MKKIFSFVLGCINSIVFATKHILLIGSFFIPYFLSPTIGFLKVWKSIEPHLKSHIMNLDVREIEIVGYSHGAAIALLCYEYCKYNRPDCAIEGAGFGAPRVFWGRVPDVVRERCKSFKVVRCGRDIVTHVPPAIFGFKHISEVVEVGESVGLVADHYAEMYLDALKK